MSQFNKVNDDVSQKRSNEKMKETTDMQVFPDMISFVENSNLAMPKVLLAIDLTEDIDLTDNGKTNITSKADNTFEPDIKKINAI